MVAFSFPPGSLSHCQRANVRAYGIYDGVVLWANSAITLRIYRNGAVPFCDFRPAPLPPRPLPVPTIPPFPH